MGAQLDSGGRKGGISPNINVTPLVDVVLVLLIIFMVVLPDMQEGKSIAMIKVEQADKNMSDGEPLTVTIDVNEVYTLGKDDTSRAAVLEAMRAAYHKDTTQPVLLRADAGLPYRVVRDFFHEVQQIGFEHIALGVGMSREWSDEGEGA